MLDPRRATSRTAGREKRIKLAVTGDVMLGRLMNEVVRTFGVSYPWGDTLSHLKSADLTLINLECVIASNGKPWTRTPKVFHFRAEPRAIEVLRVAGIDYVSLANNHTLDFEEDAMLEMIQLLDQNGIAHAGAGRNIREAMQPAFLEGKGVRLGFISFTDNEPAWEATDDAPGVNYIDITTEGRYFDRVKNCISLAREGGADLVILSNHWGPNMRLRPSRRFKEFARATIDAGVDIYVGHSAHLFQGIEIYQGKPIIFDAGDFVDDYAVDDELRNDWSFLYELTATAKGVDRIELFPVLISNFQVNFAQGDEFEGIARRMQELCDEMGTEIVRKNGKLEVVMTP